MKISLEENANYDTSGWKVDPRGKNKNIIRGVLKDGKPVVILIRPTDGNKVIFHELFEKEALAEDNSELWGCSLNTSP